MLSCQGFFLAVTSISVVLADILVQPNYEHQYKNPQYLQHHSLLQYPTQPQTEQYHIKQSPNEQTIPYLPKIQSVQTVYPYYKSYQDKALVALRPPYHHLYHHHYWLPKPNHFHYAKIGGHGYMRPSVFVGYPQPSIVHYQHTRSRRSTPTDIESSKSPIVANDNDVATKSPLIDTKHLTDIDSLLPKHEPTDTNDKHVKNRQTDDRPSGLLLGLYPENMYRSPPTESTIKDKMQHPPLTSSPVSSSTPKYPNEKAPTQLTPIQPTLETVFQGNGQNYEASRINHDESHFTHNEPYTKFEPFSNPIPIVFQAKSLNEEPASQIAYDKYYNNYDGTYEDAVDESTRQFNRYEYLPKYDSVYSEELMPQVILQKHARNYQQAIYPELEKKTLQKITNMDVTNTAEPRQDKFAIHIPFIPNNSEKESLGTNNAPVTTTFVQPLDSFVHNQYKNNEQLSGTDETDILFDSNKFVPKQYYYYSVNNDLDYDSDDYSDEYLDDEDLDNDLYERTSYSAHLKPVIVTDYVLYTNISPRTNALTTPKIQFSDLPEKKSEIPYQVPHAIIILTDLPLHHMFFINKLLF
ncbi:uncharacterized protein LOC105429008 [Pogonomyrmex barbatus]|uniref:Uncharacterized protein LOC105429008 n=1 Tax=Pogonomyrmex barbatus TaxID=144034 RepID=A0A6I9WC43_9HYME|nr:uncharacterized protein LOC105429008 [Pogonomyrmex barbatus]